MNKVIDGIIYTEDMKSVKGVESKGIKSAIIADGAEFIKMFAFADCAALKEITIPNSMADIKPSAFKNCTSLLTVRLGDNVENIASSWFTALPPQYEIICDTEGKTYKLIKRSKVLRAHVKEIALSDAKSEKKKQVQSAGVSAILSSALEGYSDSQFKVLNSRKSGASALIRIGKNCGVFRFGSDSAKWMPKVPKIIEILSDQEKDGEAIFAEIKKRKLTLCDISSPESVDINSDVFGNLNLFTSGYLKGCNIKGDGNLSIFGASSIGDMRCLQFKTLSIGSGLEYIYRRAFASSQRLKSVTLSEGIRGISERAFEDCTLLSSIHIPKTIRLIGDDAFRNTNIFDLGYSIPLSHGSFTIKDGLAIENGDTLLYCAVERYEVKIFDGITKINDFAFYCRKKIKYVFIPASVKEIGRSAFAYCDSLKKIEYGGTVAQLKAMEKGKYWRDCVETMVIIMGEIQK